MGVVWPVGVACQEVFSESLFVELDQQSELDPGERGVLVGRRVLVDENHPPVVIVDEVSRDLVLHDFGVQGLRRGRDGRVHRFARLVDAYSQVVRYQQLEEPLDVVVDQDLVRRQLQVAELQLAQSIEKLFFCHVDRFDLHFRES